eukprot:TRINITY_DN8166_c0_g1_i1.p1 TRINITY_DN8166_c0_g1~~TRINITY_DN8166_c0_g1_i1.p1  ORF type:complete len:118 (+),score=25.03 TRINITY_DN8166_c0_g1_i1:141-494(+)
MFKQITSEAVLPQNTTKDGLLPMEQKALALVELGKQMMDEFHKHNPLVEDTDDEEQTKTDIWAQAKNDSFKILKTIEKTTNSLRQAAQTTNLSIDVYHVIRMKQINATFQFFIIFFH